jgi:osmotically inducible protein OsmC
MPKRTAKAEWCGDLLAGNGKMEFGSGAFEGAYSFKSRFEDGTGTNPEELIAAAHAGCYSMALSAVLSEAGFKPNSVKTTAEVTVVKSGDGFAITKSALTTQADIPGIDEAVFQEKANAAKSGCPVSKALAGVEITLDAKLV